MTESKKTTKANEPKFTKLGLVHDTSFSVIDRDIINIVLDDDKQYTLADVKAKIEEFKKGV